MVPSSTDSVKSKFLKQAPDKHNKKCFENLYNFIFCDEVVELLNIPSIFKDNQAKSTLKDHNLNLPTQGVVYNLTKFCLL